MTNRLDLDMERDYIYFCLLALGATAKEFLRAVAAAEGVPEAETESILGIRELVVELCEKLVSFTLEPIVMERRIQIARRQGGAPLADEDSAEAIREVIGELGDRATARARALLN